jgi:sugar/nucleoside kinase (ribokinase family)
MLLVVGAAVVAYRRDIGAPYTGPWPGGSPATVAYVAGRLGVPTARSSRPASRPGAW